MDWTVIQVNFARLSVSIWHCRAFKSTFPPNPYQLEIYPLMPGVSVRLPFPVRKGQGTHYLLSFPSPHQSPSIPKRPVKPKRRAEYASLSSVSDKDQIELRRSHSSRMAIQLALYRFTLQTLLNLRCTDSDEKASHRLSSPGCLLLDLGCGNLANGFLPLGHLLPSSTQLPVGVDLFDSNQSSLSVNCVTCDLSRRPLSQTAPLQLTPFCDHVFDYILSISFLQWLVAKDEPISTDPTHISLVYQFAKEVIRLLNRPDENETHGEGGQCVIQFYPSSWADVDRVCYYFTQISPNLKGCRILARPVPNRGIKLFLYFTSLKDD